MASVAIAGGLYGYQVLWVVILSALFAFIAQYLAAKTGLIGGQRHYFNWWNNAGAATLAWVLTIDAVAATWLAAAAAHEGPGVGHGPDHRY